jgi:tetratricopeptide (TPR) repeat protein
MSAMLLFVFFAALALSGCETMKIIRIEVMLNREKYDDAILLLEDYMSKNPNAVKEGSQLGFAYLKTGRMDEAIATLEKVISIQPGEPNAVLYLGLAYLNKANYSKAIDVWQGFKDKKRPLVEAEIKRLTTLIRIADSQRFAKKAIENEKKMHTVKVDESTIAVCYYKDLSKNKELQGFQKGLAAMVISDLSKIKSLKVVERLRMQALLQEMKLGQTGIVDPITAPRIGRLAGAENLVVGTLSGDILVTTTLASTNAGKIKGSTTATIAKSAFFEIPKKIVLDTAQILGIQLTAQEKTIIGAPQTKSYAAVIHYGLAIDALDAGHWKKAKNLFAQALMEDPQFELAKRGLLGCPDGSSPSIGQLANMSSADISGMAESGINQALVNQAKADKEAEELMVGGGGGGGGGH